MTDERKHDASKGRPVERPADAFDNLSDALVEEILSSSGTELLAEVREDFGDSRALAVEFDRVFARVARQHAVHNESANRRNAADARRRAPSSRSAGAVRPPSPGWVEWLLQWWGSARPSAPVFVLARMAPVLGAALLGVVGTVAYFAMFDSPGSMPGRLHEAAPTRPATDITFDGTQAERLAAARLAEAKKIRTVTVRLGDSQASAYTPLRYEPAPSDSISRLAVPPSDAFSFVPLPTSAYSRFVAGERYVIESGDSAQRER
jgi:hypothetical protein